MNGVRPFALWPLAQAAEPCFGSLVRPASLSVRQAGIEIDVDEIAAATQELVAKGCRLLAGLTNTPRMR